MSLSECPDPVVFAILSMLDDRSLVQTRGVSSTFRALADMLLLEHFLEKWGVTLDEQGHPPAATVLPGVSLDSFVWRHIVARGDTLPRIAIKYRTDVPTLKRRNMIISDHTLATRDCLYVPVGSLEEVSARRVAFTYCQHAKRRFLVVLKEGEAPPPKGPAPRADRVEQLAVMLQRGLKMDTDTARYYLAQARGSLRAAIAAYEDDKRWERVMRPGRRR